MHGSPQIQILVNYKSPIRKLLLLHHRSTTVTPSQIGTLHSLIVVARARGAKATAASFEDSRSTGVRTICSTNLRTSTATLTIYGGGANSERVAMPTLEKAIQRVQTKKKKKPWV